MFSTMRAAAPRMGFAVSPSSTSGAVAPGARGSGGGSWWTVTAGAEGVAGAGASPPFAERGAVPAGT